MLNIRKAPPPAKKTPFQCGNIINDVIEAIASMAIITHKTVRTFFLLIIMLIFYSIIYYS